MWVQNYEKISAEGREKLYNEIWDEAMYKVAPRYNISDVELRKRCVKWGIPIPSREYRGRMHAGQKPYRTPLPPLTNEMKRYVYGYAITYNNLKSLPEAALYTEVPLFAYSEKTRELLNEVRQRPIPIPVSASELPQAVQEKLSELKKDRRCKNAHSFQRAYSVAKGIADYLKMLEGWGRVEVESARLDAADIEWKVNYLVEGDQVGLRFAESYSRRPGRIEPKIEFEYRDQPGQPLEKQAGEIIYRLFLESGKARQYNEIGERREQQRRAEEARARELAPLIEKEDKKVKRALEYANAYKDSVLIREYAEAYREKHIQEFPEKPELKDFYTWLLARADWLDPFIENDYDALLKREAPK